MKPNGSYVIGNPAAKTKLVEYLSYTCSHCAEFSQQGAAVLKRDYIARGRTSIEVRHAIRDTMDYAAALLARCDGPAKFLGHSDAIFAAQGDWYTQGLFFEASNGKRLAAMNITQQLTALTLGSGLDSLMRKRGMSEQRIGACLANAAQQKLMEDQASEAWDTRKIPGTPAFYLNGALVKDTGTWAALKPKLDAALN
nr:thioredoxin domain-containing protein [Sphingobium boeckii]